MKYLFFISILCLSGCIGPPTKEELAKANYGEQLKQEEAEIKIHEFLDNWLKDSESAKIKISAAHKGWYKDGMENNYKLWFGYIVKTRVNAKNSYGGYTGFTPMTFIFYNGEIVGAYVQRANRGKYGTTYYMDKIR